MKVSNIIKSSLITEKSVALKDKQNKYIFSVALNSTKSAIADEIARLFGVEVLSVATQIMPGKPKRVFSTAKRKKVKYTKTSKWKKAVVQVKEGQKIEELTKE